MGVRVAGLVLVAASLVACGGGSDGSDAHEPTTLAVPADYDTVQAAVDAARSGDTVLVSPGTYNEAVRVDTAGVRLQGTDRSDVVFDGDGLKGNGITVTAADVVVANLTVQNFNQNGVLVTGFTKDGGIGHGSDGYETLDPEAFPPIEGFAVRYVTASNNGLYGIYAFDSHDGVLEHNYASGHPDSGIYVGQCQECRILVRDNVLERNAVGYEQANASDSVVVTGNRLVGNRVGLTVLSDYQEAFVPTTDGTVVGNLVADNNEVDTPHQAEGGFGIGIGLSGAVGTTVERNLVTGNETAGIAISSSADLPPTGNELSGNTATGNGADIWYAASTLAPGSGNCLADNTVTSTRPPGLAADLTCADGSAGAGDQGAGVELTMARDPQGIAFFDVVAPPAQPSMPAADADLGPGFVEVDLDQVPLPAAGLLADLAAVR
ncbi:hypothetical protein BH11ACT8_BH11ACT8_28090 [soil metagenome]